MTIYIRMVNGENHSFCQINVILAGEIRREIEFARKRIAIGPVTEN